MSNEANMALVREFLESMWHQRDFSVADRYIAPDLQAEGPMSEGLPPGPEGTKIFVGGMLEAFPDVTFEITRQESDGEWVHTWLTYSGTNHGPLMGQPATGRSISVDVLVHDRVVNGQVVESSAEWDPSDMMRQLGLQ